MATKMNSKTHKVISATYTYEYLYAVPIDWDVKDITMRYGELFYKQEKKDVPKEEYEPDMKYPNQIEDADVDIEDYFDCEEEEEEDCAECCRCGEDVSNDEGEGKLVDGEYWCVDCVEDAHQCELCKKHVQETEYLPSKEDEEKQQILGNDYCLECYKKVEKFEFVENIDLDKHE